MCLGVYVCVGAVGVNGIFMANSWSGLFKHTRCGGVRRGGGEEGEY